MVRIACSNHDEADAIWRLWLDTPEPPAASLYVNGILVALLSSADDRSSIPHGAAEV